MCENQDEMKKLLVKFYLETMKTIETFYTAEQSEYLFYRKENKKVRNDKRAILF